MTNFNFYLDQKVTTWMRTHFSVDAESYEEACKIAEQMTIDGQADMPWDEIDEFSKDVMTTNQNSGFSTQQLFNLDGEVIFQNGN